MSKRVRLKTPGGIVGGPTLNKWVESQEWERVQKKPTEALPTARARRKEVGIKLNRERAGGGGFPGI